MRTEERICSLVRQRVYRGEVNGTFRFREIGVNSIASRFESVVLHFVPLVNLARVLSPLVFVLAICIALGGQVRAVDIVDLDDADDIASTTCDDFIASVVGRDLVPPSHGRAVYTPPLTIGAGRAVVSELFRPPQV